MSANDDWDAKIPAPPRPSGTVGMAAGRSEEAMSAKMSAGRKARLEYAAETGNGVTQDMLCDALTHIAALEQELTEAKAIHPFDKLPAIHAEHVDRWLTSNGKTASDVRWSLYPIGMVQRWIERAETAEASAAEVKRALVPLADAAEKTLARLHNLGYEERGYMCRELQDALATARAELEKL